MTYLLIVLAYVFCHGLTSLVVTPVQSILLPEITMFASLIYLPHGVRVLASWASGWKAIPTLFIGAGLASWLFTPADEWDMVQGMMLESLFVGAISAYFAFEFLRLFGCDFYFGSQRRLNWKGMILIGAISSVVNSVGQTLVFSGVIAFERFAQILIIYAFGDLIGLVICMFALMFVFRWVRGYSLAKRR